MRIIPAFYGIDFGKHMMIVGLTVNAQRGLDNWNGGENQRQVG